MTIIYKDLLLDLRAKEAELNKEIKRVENLAREQSRDELKKVPATYTYKVTVATMQTGYFDPVGSIRIIRKQTNRAKWDAIVAKYGHSVSSLPNAQVQSVAYFLAEGNILTHTGGGYLLLTDPVHITQDEWEAIKAGNIPERLLRQ